MYKNLIINPELYVLTFATQDNTKFEQINNFIKEKIKEYKIKKVFNNNQDKLYVFRENYEQVITLVSDYLKNITNEEQVYWSNVNGILLPCGYYQVAIASPKVKKSLIMDDINHNIELKKYYDKMCQYLQTTVYFAYDYYKDTTIISLKDDSYESSLLKFNEFVKENGTGPFECINTSTRYGKIEQTKYPILSKKK